MKYHLVMGTNSSGLWKGTTPDPKKGKINNLYGNNEDTFPITRNKAWKLIVLIN